MLCGYQVRVMMRKLLRCKKSRKHFTVIRNKTKKVADKKDFQTETESSDNDNHRINALGIQMLSSTLHEQIFGRESLRDENKIKKSINHLEKHGLWGKESAVLPDVDLKLPELFGNNIDEHFRMIAEYQSATYRKLVDDLVETEPPPFPPQWNYQAGWTKYSQDGRMELVDFPEENALVFDVEVCLSEGSFPTLATAVGVESWYSWCSERLIEDRLSCSQRAYINDLIPLETKIGKVQPLTKKWEKKIVIGHNVSFDRSRIKEQYLIKGPETRFLDTMSLHIATSGLTSYQRSLLMAEKTGSKSKDVQEAKMKSKLNSSKQWMQISSMNNLGDVHSLYCPHEAPVQKETREIFIKGTITDVRNKFQELMLYCANDVKATHSVLCKLLPLFFERFPHPVTFAGLLEMSTTYLPVNQNWERYLRDADDTYNDLEQEMKLSLMHLANEACELYHNERYKEDPWLWDLDWSIKNLRIKKLNNKLTKKLKLNPTNDESSTKPVERNSNISEIPIINEDDDEDIQPSTCIKELLSTEKNLYKVQSLLPGYPAWYCQLCEKFSSENEDWTTGPNLLSAQTKISPKLLRLTWDGYPLHYDPKHRWGYLVPGKNILDSKHTGFPIRQVLAMCSGGLNINFLQPNTDSSHVDLLWEQLESGIGDPVELSALWKEATTGKEFKKKKRKYIEPSENVSPIHHGNGPYDDVDIPGCWFYRLPHKNGSKYCVGNPLAKDFLTKISDGTLKAWSGAKAEKALKLSKMISYWRNAQKRIKSQMVVWLKKNELSKTVTKHPDYDDQLYGAILPQIIAAGTVTRRAVEPTWLTASNAYGDRVGSELKSMIQTPLGYHFVGADVDSQELWIAGILGDSHFAGIHGCTAFGWMILQGKKSNGTDMHSKTANTIGITREQAKILNYGRIYGAGQPFAQQLLMQFNHRLKAEEAKEKAEVMYAATKGVRKYILSESGNILYDQVFCSKDDRSPQKLLTSSENNITMTKFEVLQMLQQSGSTLEFQDVIEKPVWSGGTESPMFNKLEEIAQSDEPVTPILGCHISRALEPAYVGNNFMTSRVNWVVQSSAVDYLHLMLVCMRWLCDIYEIDARFCISIHDEVRYLVKSEDRYRAALALQITNLLTRSLFAYKLKMNDLPQSVAFFSTVDIDTVLRKEVTMNCTTPSNPHGLQRGYNIPLGEALDIQELLQKTNGQLRKK